MLNAIQEDKIRDLLTIVTIYFQLDDNHTSDESRAAILSNQKKLCKNAVVELVSAMGIDGNFVKNNYSKPQNATVEVNHYALKRLANLMLDKFGYKKDGREKFILSCINKI